MDGGREGTSITAASAAYLNPALEPTPDSVRSCVAPAIGRGSPEAFGFKSEHKNLLFIILGSSVCEEALREYQG